MISSTFLQKQLLPVISNNIALSQVFIVVLFFENYSTIFNNSSLFDLTLEVSNIQLAPFLWFFIFIVGCKALWYIGLGVKLIISNIFNWYSNTSKDKISFSTAFTSFILLISSAIYLTNIYGFNSSLAPISIEKHPITSHLLMMFPAITILLSFIHLTNREVKYDWENVSDKALTKN